MDRQTFIQQYNNFPIFFAPGCISLLGNHLDKTGSRQLGITINNGVYLAIVEKEQLHCNIQIFNGKGGHENSERSLPLLNTLHDLVNLAHKNSDDISGIDLIFYSDLPKDSLFGGDDIYIMALKFALIEQYHFSNTSWLKPEGSYQQWIAAAKSNHFSLIHQNKTEYIPWKTSEYLLVLAGSVIMPETTITTLEERKNELAGIHDQINEFFEISSLGDLSAEDQEWLDRVLPDEILKKRLRHVVNENTAIEITSGLLSDGKINHWGRILDHAYESMVLDFEIQNKAAEKFRNMAIETGLIQGSTVIADGQHFAVLNLIKANELDLFTEKIRQLYMKETGQELFIFPLNTDKGACRRVTATGN